MSVSLQIGATPKNDIWVVENNGSVSPISWLQENKLAVEDALHSKGAVLLRDFKINSLSEFNQFANLFSPSLLDYVNRSTPRTKLGGKIYTSTEYPAERIIPQHNENAYTNKWPTSLLFYCVIPAGLGGETPISDSREILTLIDKEIVEKFEKFGVMYVRNYMPGIDLPWQEVFQTKEKEKVAEYCSENNIEFCWHGQDHLETKQICQATQYHPKTGEKIWFNQAHLFHVSAGGHQEKELLLKEFGKKRLPRNTYFGDGSEIPDDVIAHISAAFNRNLIKFRWERGDLLVIDNMLKTHGRMSFEGARKIAVAMS